MNYWCEKLTICLENTVFKQYQVSFNYSSFEKNIMEDSIYLGFWFAYNKQITPQGRIPKIIPTNHVYMQVNNNNFITKKRF